MAISNVRLNSDQGNLARGVIDFSGAGEAAATVTIGGIVYTEVSTTPDPTQGEWTNGASASDSATSLAAAINGDTRKERTTNYYNAKVSAAGDTIFVYAKAGQENVPSFTLTTDSAAVITVEAGAGGRLNTARMASRVTHTITSFDVLAAEARVRIPFTPTGFQFQVLTTAGLNKAVTDLGTIDGDDFVLTQAGATQFAATDVLELYIWE